MVFQHYLVVHLVDVVAGQNQHILWIVRFHVFQILVDRVRRTGVPIASFAPLIRRKYRHTTYVAVQIPRNTDSNMCIQPQRLILGQNAYRVHSRIDTVT